jgi:hypothetical protein
VSSGYPKGVTALYLYDIRFQMSIKIYPFTHANMSCSWREHRKDTTQIQNAKQKAGKN